MTTAAAPPEPAVRARSARNLVDLVFRARELSLVIALAALVAITAGVNGNFLSGQGIEDILLNTAILALLAVGQSLVVITRNLDLSVGSVVGLVAFVTGDLLAGGWGMVPGIVLGVAIGAVCGLLNGLLVSFCRVPALVVTLGTLYVIQGVGHFIAHGRQINAVDLLRAAVAALGGQGGGGRPDMAQGGGPDGSKANDALDAVKDALEKVAA